MAFMVDEVPWEVDLRTGNYWPIVSDQETSEGEVEKEIEQGGEEVERAETATQVEGAGRAEDNQLDAARELVRAEVR